MLKNDALDIISSGIKASLPFEETLSVLKKLDLTGDALTVFAIGKAAIPMAKAADIVLGDRIKNGLVVTKYAHTGDFFSPHFEVIESAHPVSDENSIRAAERAIEIAHGLTEKDTVIVLLSGGGSALFEKSKTTPEFQRNVTQKLLARGAEIEEMNALRRRISLVKGGGFAGECYPARVITLALSDVLSNDKSVIAGGITVRDETADEDIKAYMDKYLYDIPENELSVFFDKNSVDINDGGYYFVGDIYTLCNGAAKRAAELGYEVEIPSLSLRGEAREKASEILSVIKEKSGKRAYIYGGETTVTLKGRGKGGRNQEMALAGAIKLRGRKNTVFACVGSDGTDGPTDAAGGIADGETYNTMLSMGVNPEKELEDNNSYFALKKADALVVTGPTGTNVNDIMIILTDI